MIGVLTNMAELLDSGSRRQFASGAVRDIQEDKGRCDLLPLDVVASLMVSSSPLGRVLISIYRFIQTDQRHYLYDAIRDFCVVCDWTIPECVLEVAKHYQDGARKYGERNWEKGIPLHCYIDSGVRHLLKFADKRTDEPHDRAFVWNMFGAIWTYDHKPTLNDVTKSHLSSD